MFNLEQAILEWRRQMLTAGIKSPAPLDELEIHLREEIERQMKSGTNAQQIFEKAAETIGQANSLNIEFKKSRSKQGNRIVMMIAGVIGVAVGMAFVMPVIALYLNQSAMSVGDVALLMLGIALALGGGSAAVFSYK